VAIGLITEWVGFVIADVPVVAVLWVCLCEPPPQPYSDAPSSAASRTANAAARAVLALLRSAGRALPIAAGS
jgi:hypothetical protein